MAFKKIRQHGHAERCPVTFAFGLAAARTRAVGQKGIVDHDFVKLRGHAPEQAAEQVLGPGVRITERLADARLVTVLQGRDRHDRRRRGMPSSSKSCLALASFSRGTVSERKVSR
jgi:hypothetical protein